MQENIQPAHGLRIYPQFSDYPTYFSLPQPEHGLRHVERRQTRRYGVRGHLLSVCDYYAGQILDISRTGLSCKIVHFLGRGDGKVCRIKPRQSDRLDILSPGLNGYFFRDLQVREVWDLNLGRLYPENENIIVYRRSIQLVTPFQNDGLASLQRYLVDDLREKMSPPRTETC